MLNYLDLRNQRKIVEGNGTYLYGQIVVVKAKVIEGYQWVCWESSNPTICPNNDSEEYTFLMPAEDIIFTAKAHESLEPEIPNVTKEIKEKNTWLIIAGSVAAFNILIVGLLIWYIRRKH